ncbi:hypothetical protein L1049_000054 [Liquidambar formosana]|uniref:Uncharacterized protein n=1 Tax=Liquidambar formosana TaxID=63359 RepID=A0AAP0N2Y8_LIQFO
MKFLLEFVSCCGSNYSSRPSEAPTSPPARVEETRSLVPPRRYRRRKRGRLGASGSVSAAAAEWRPSLCAISEDNVVMEKEGRTVGSERTVKRKAQVRVQVRSHSDEEFRQTPFPMVVPAFSPTPFLF